MVDSKWAVLDDIDALVDEQMSQFDRRTGYDHNNRSTVPKCRCGEDFHGLPITQTMQSMRLSGYMDPGYVYADDDSRIMCPGTEVEGPLWREPSRFATSEWGNNPYTQAALAGFAEMAEDRAVRLGFRVPPEFDVQASTAERVLRRHRETAEMLALFGVPVGDWAPPPREPQRWDIRVGDVEGESRFMRDWHGLRRRVVNEPPREHSGHAQDQLFVLFHDPESAALFSAGHSDEPTMDDNEWVSRYRETIRENGFEPVDVAETVSHRTLNRITVQLSSRRSGRMLRILDMWLEDLEQILANTRGNALMPLVHHRLLGSMTIVQAMDWCLNQLGRRPVKPQVLLVSPQTWIVEARFSLPQRRWAEAWSFEYAEWLGWDISEPRREIVKRVGRNVMGQTLEGQTIEPQAGRGLPLMELSDVQRRLLRSYRSFDGRRGQYGTPRAGIEVRRETFRNTEADAQARHPSSWGTVGVDPGDPDARPVYMRLANGDVQQIGSMTDEQAAEFNRHMYDPEVAFDATDPADVTPSELILGAVVMGGVFDEVPPEPDARTPQERALPRPSTTPPMWARNPTRTRRGAR
ncbi:hypothetical protein [Rhodococcoides fascians]|uniref:hypothetical protein n=1 Tax=Rhodococcoides fascians TaxID=1828 RepID=UPI00050C3095|nr:hypothetical protein [Rhodococcus fascians]